MPVRFHEEARAEFTAGARYYEQQRRGLGLRFVAEMEETLARIVRAPHLHRTVDGDIRKVRVRRFPYGVIYRERGRVIEVVAVMHLHRRPGYWRRRV